jgi:uncharacterized protein with HEPN domain
MPQPEDLVRLRHMSDHAREAVELVRGKTLAELNASRVLQLALVRLVEIVGEAAGRVSREAQGEHSQIPWAQIAGMRNRLVHGYDSVNLDVLWQTIREDLPELIAQLERIVLSDES